jgi:monoamine oxidase
MKKAYDVVIVGAGASGLACAEALHKQKTDFLLIEGKAKIGGRVLSHGPNALQAPVELGAEFIHGAPKYTLQWLERLNQPFYDAQNSHLILKKQRLVLLEGYLAQMAKFTDKMSVDQKTDRSISDFLKRHPGLQRTLRPYFRSFVEGFHAADLDIMGERELAAAEQTEDDELNSSSMFRPVQPYASLLEGIFQAFANPQNFSPETVLRRVEWERNRVKLALFRAGAREAVETACRKLVLTLPVGVLKSKQVEFDPMPGALARFLESAHMGHVQRITFRFRQRFWENLSEQPIAFMHLGPDDYFPTWWSLQPLRVPHLVGWQGGPKAKEMSQYSREKRVQIALKSLAKLAQRPASEIESLLEDAHTHDWSSDPFALGAYSYLGVGGLGREKACRQIQDTLFFAGEATASGSARGTVHGAFNSGVRAAELASRNLP